MASSASPFHDEPRRLGAAHEVDAARQPGRAERAEQPAGEQAAAERQAAAQQIGLEADQRAADDAAPERRLAFVHAQPHLVVGGQPRQDRRPRRCLRGRAGGSAPACRRAPRRRAARASASCACATGVRSPLPRPIRAPALRSRARSPPASGSGTAASAVRDRPSAIACIAASKTSRCAPLPGGAQAPHPRPPLAVERLLDGAEQRRLLHPAAGEGVERQHRAHGRMRRQVRAPARQLGGLERRRAGRAELVEQHDHRLADPGQQLHLGRDVAGRLRRLGGVDEVEHHVGLVAQVAHRLLAGPERPVAPAVPDLAQEPADRAATTAAGASPGARCRRSPACPRAAAARPRAWRSSSAPRRTR